MKRRQIVSLALLVVAVFMCFAGCKQTPEDTGGSNGNSVQEELPEDIDASAVDILTQRWVAAELSFISEIEYSASEETTYQLIVDGVFTNRESGTVLTIPAFYDGDNTWRIRFAPTEYGIWDYKIVCSGDASLNGKTGTVGSNAYRGNLEIYKRGFVTTAYGHKYFTYADGTPFFYLGDTHWTMFTEELDEAGSHAGDIETDSHFKYIVDKRVEQGYTVYQSEPIGAPFDLSAGKMNRRVINGFQEADAYFAYIAQKGLVHANAQFFFTSSMTDRLAADDAFLEMISRYWVARYGAYPVMWTLAQECDNDFYAENKTNKFQWNAENNPWVKVAEYLHKYDAYQHPLTGHQEGSDFVSVTGKGEAILKKEIQGKVSNHGASVFASEEVTQRTGHDWYAAQWKQNINGLPDFASAKDYWESPKVGINYEDRYAYLWTKDFGARARGWISYLNGFFGYGYGCADIWYYKSTYDMEGDSVLRDGLETITEEEKKMEWSEAIELESGYQVCYMKEFFAGFEWWRLIPDFNNGQYFNASSGTLYSCASIGNETYVVYLYNRTKGGGTLAGLEAGAEYTMRWFNPRTGQFEGEVISFTPDTQDKNGGAGYAVQKPDTEDWTLFVTKK